MSLASRERSPLPLLNTPIDARPPLFGYELSFFGRPELNPWRPAFDIQLAAELAEREDEEDEHDEDGIPRRLVQRGIPPAQVPALGHRLLSGVHALAADLIAETAGRDRFLAVTPSDLYHAAETFAR